MKRSIALIALINVGVVFAVKNKTNSPYDQSDRQVFAQQQKNNNKTYCPYNTNMNIVMRQPKKFNHKIYGNKPSNKIRYQ